MKVGHQVISSYWPLLELRLSRTCARSLGWISELKWDRKDKLLERWRTFNLQIGRKCSIFKGEGRHDVDS